MLQSTRNVYKCLDLQRNVFLRSLKSVVVVVVVVVIIIHEQHTRKT